ncbi:hypothetical protein ACT17_03880 [Mycolicibacterium conceptionense]|jgi:hypothetical protein|uniref:PE-PGRS family protein n=2 Tax=Mycolicibacterium TaxID=1866885 RepID=A0ABR5G0B4_9MYCO|nr:MULTISPECIES: hypothetical protein [Mycolicibacterium]KLO53584.1 hypothetical protein ABW05_20910 [Mycolicibacterium senegalense]KMV19869.1 hypothetical protein ACT17_03880 [Mycolicibacterium conceptionense]OBJ95763.1 hypothetical protein A5639_03775 [Mycolicibacterium conceptionense]QZH60997.1 hypothetical protein K1X22_04165 [Mycolicibacterium farcinogenes]
MTVTRRASLMSGIALVGAGAIALTPISAVPTNIPTPAIQSAAVQLTTAVDPLEAWIKVFTNTGVSATTLGEQILADPAPILTQLLHNGAGHAQTVGTIVQGMGSGVVQWVKDLPLFEDMVKTALENGQYDAAIMGAVMPVFMLAINAAMPLMQMSSVTVGITANLYNVAQTIANPMTLMGTVLGTLQIMSSTAGNLGIGVQSFADGAKAGDVETAVKALIATPALVLDGLINGNGNTPGLLTPDKPLFEGMPGPIAGVMVQVRQAIAQALGAPAPAAAVALRAKPDSVAPESPSALPSATVNTVTVSLTTDTVVKAEVTEAPTEKVVTDATADATNTGSARIAAKVPSTKPAEKLRGDVRKTAESIGNKVNSTVSKIRDGLKKGMSKPAKPSKKAESNAGGSSSSPGPSNNSE